MSFSSLPPELVQEIIESTVPHTYYTRTYLDRQRTLCRLSLVSKIFRSIAQPLLLQIVQLLPFGDASELPKLMTLARSNRSQGSVRWLVISWEFYMPTYRKQTEEDQFVETLRGFDTIRYLTAASLASLEEKKYLACLLSISFSHLTYLHLSSSRFQPLNTTLLPSLHSLTLYDVSSELFRSLVDPSTVPNLRNLAIFVCSKASAQWLKTPSISRFLLQLETLYFDSYTWSELDERFRRSLASRTLINVAHATFRTAFHPEASVIHVRFESLSFKPTFTDEQVIKKLDLCASSIKDCSSLKSLFLDSTFRCSSRLPTLIRSSVENLARICQERKIDLVFERVPIDDELDPLISAEFSRRQRNSRELEAQGGEVATG